ncbi:hypothetical protein CspeluHIS016_0702330 [Cutaneotrichosporon spelunceum]|uniref:Uncharacterized protein n=1 Tax=Cutaneotrichosporon spelunceum TaxID=1672016 RepID=A0AAD3TYF4_9TREE|nr:hypothetical protein CspeluHIS016_0702330 [Cutaneotrichosporon spelunceum]
MANLTAFLASSPRDLPARTSTHRPTTSVALVPISPRPSESTIKHTDDYHHNSDGELCDCRQWHFGGDGERCNCTLCRLDATLAGRVVSSWVGKVAAEIEAGEATEHEVRLAREKKLTSREWRWRSRTRLLSPLPEDGESDVPSPKKRRTLTPSGKPKNPPTVVRKIARGCKA